MMNNNNNNQVSFSPILGFRKFELTLQIFHREFVQWRAGAETYVEVTVCGKPCEVVGVPKVGGCGPHFANALYPQFLNISTEIWDEIWVIY